MPYPLSLNNWTLRTTLFYNAFMTTCILLSAGLSERFGSPKALARLHGMTVIEHIQTTLLQSSCDQIIVVLGAHHKEVQPSIFIHSRIRIVYNKTYYFGQTSSVQAGWREVVDSTQGVLFLPVDCPLIWTSRRSVSSAPALGGGCWAMTSEGTTAINRNNNSAPRNHRPAMPTISWLRNNAYLLGDHTAIGMSC